MVPISYSLASPVVSSWEERLFGSSLTPEVVSELSVVMTPIVLARGSHLFEAGDDATHLYVLDRGKIKLSRRAVPDDPRRESLLTIVSEGNVFGELSLLDPGPRTTTATAITACNLRQLSRSDFHALISRHPQLGVGMSHQLARRLRHVTDYASDLVLHDVHGRTARTLQHLLDMFGERQPDDTIRVPHGLTQQEIAHMVGASRESVNKILMEFTENQVLALSHRAFVVLDSARLSDLAEPTITTNYRD